MSDTVVSSAAGGSAVPSSRAIGNRRPAMACAVERVVPALSLVAEKVFASLVVLAIMGAVIIKLQQWLDGRIAPWTRYRNETGG